MSWLARSIVNSLAPDHGDDSDGSDDSAGETSKTAIGGEDQARGVKEDISELTQTLTRQLWGVASFLAPPPTQTLAPSSSPNSPDDPAAAEGGESPRIAGIRNDLAEIGGRFRSGISMLSSHKAVSEISKIASTLFAPDEWEEEEGEEGSFGAAVGVTDDVLAFVQNVSMHPETWLDFPLLLDDDDYDDFNMSDAQQEHALAVERHVPRLTALRIELCPSHMSEGCFWKVYFVLLHPRLNKYDAELLSTPQIVQARAMLQDLQNRTRPGSERSEKDVSTLTVTPGERESITSPAISQKDVSTLIVTPGETVTSPANIVKTTAVETHTSEESTLSVPLTELITEKHPIQSTEIKVIDKSVIEEEPLVQQDETKNYYPSTTSKISIQSDEEDADEWLEEETGEVGVSGASIPFGNDEDVSFSDLEEEDDHASSKSKTCNVASTEKEDSGWVQLNKNTGDSANSHTKGSNDWLDLDLDAA